MPRPRKRRYRGKKWIQRATSSKTKGALHRQLGIPVGQTIPLRVLEKASHAPGKLGQRARFALLMRRLQAKKGATTSTSPKRRTATRTAATSELKVLAHDAARSGRIRVDGDRVYLDGSPVRVPRLAAALRKAVHATATATPAPLHAEPLTRETFAREVLALGRAIHGSGRFGQHKVFLAALWEKAHHTPRFARFTLPVFQHELIACHRAGLLSLSRADLTSAMDPHLVRASEVAYLNATFHFLNL